MIGAIGSYFDLGSVKRPLSSGVGDSGAEVSCLRANIGVVLMAGVSHS